MIQLQLSIATDGCDHAPFATTQLHRAGLVWCERAAPPLLVAGDGSDPDVQPKRAGGDGETRTLWKDCVAIVRNLALLRDSGPTGSGGVGGLAQPEIGQPDDPIGAHVMLKICFVY